MTSRSSCVWRSGLAASCPRTPLRSARRRAARLARIRTRRRRTGWECRTRSRVSLYVPDLRSCSWKCWAPIGATRTCAPCLPRGRSKPNSEAWDGDLDCGPSSPQDLARRQPVSTPTHDVTELLHAWGRGDLNARERVVALVYDELRQRAAAHLRRERQGHTLQPTALVHEAYLRLVDQRKAEWQNRAQFLAVASQMMRRILIDRARARKRVKRN